MRAVAVMALLPLCATTSGCVWLLAGGEAKCIGEQLQHDTKFDETSPESIVVIGVSRVFKLNVASGVDDGTTWHRHHYYGGASATPEDGFVVIKLKPRKGKKRYGIENVVLSDQPAISYEFPEKTTAVFDAPPGQVTYIGGFTIDLASGGLRNVARLCEDPNITQPQAAAFMASHYPHVKRAPVMGRMDWLYKGDDNYDN
jgi:hypothetical protein